MDWFHFIKKEAISMSMWNIKPRIKNVELKIKNADKWVAFKI